MGKDSSIQWIKKVGYSIMEERIPRNNSLNREASAAELLYESAVMTIESC